MEAAVRAVEVRVVAVLGVALVVRVVVDLAAEVATPVAVTV